MNFQLKYFKTPSPFQGEGWGEGEDSSNGEPTLLKNFTPCAQKISCRKAQGIFSSFFYRKPESQPVKKSSEERSKRKWREGKSDEVIRGEKWK